MVRGGALYLLTVAAAFQVCVSAAKAQARLNELTGYRSFSALVKAGEEVAKGSFGLVLTVPYARRKTALKIVDLEDRESAESFHQEVAFMRDLRGLRGVARIRGCVLGGARPKRFGAIFMEYLPFTLEQLAPQIANLSFTERLELYLNLLEGLDQVHLKKVVHNDYKPRNVIVGAGKVFVTKIIDFGASCKVGELCRGGTAFYAPPEKLNNALESLGDPAVDVWSFLLTVIEVESGMSEIPTLPCLEESMSVECYKAFKLQILWKLNGSPTALVALLFTALDYNPALRPSLAQLRDALEAMHETATETG